MHTIRVERGDFLQRKKKGFPFLLPHSTTKTQSGVATIRASSTKTLSGVADIRKSTIKTQSGLANVRVKDTKTITGVSNIRIPTSSGGRVIVIDRRNFLPPLFRPPKGTAWFAGNPRITTTRTQTGVADIFKTTTRTQSGLADIRSSTVQTISGSGDIRATTVRTLSGSADIQKTTTVTQSGLADLLKTTTQTQSGLADVLAKSTKTISGIADIRKTTARTISGVADIGILVTKTISGVAALHNLTNKTQTGVANLQMTTTQTQSGASTIQVTGVMSGGRVTVIDRRSFLQPLVKPRKQVAPYIAPVWTRTQTGRAAIFGPTIQSTSGQADILASKTRSLIGVSFIVDTRTKTITGQSRIEGTTVQVQSGVADILNTTTQTQMGIALIGATKRFMFGLGCIIKIGTPTQSGIATIVVSTGPPSAPGSLTASGTGPVVLTWTASTPSGDSVADYEVQREACTGGTWTTIAVVSGSTLTYTDNPPVGCWLYQVIAQNTLGNSSTPSNIVSISTASTVATRDQSGQSNIYSSVGTVQTASGIALITTLDPSLGVQNTQSHYQVAKAPKANAQNTQSTLQFAKITPCNARLTQSCLLVAIPYMGSYNYAFGRNHMGHSQIPAPE